MFVKDINLTNPEENTEQNSIHKHSEGEIEGNILPGMHTEHVNVDLQKSITKPKNNTTLHALSIVACAQNKTEVMNIKNTSCFINDKHNGNAENVMSLLTYMVKTLKIPNDVFSLNNVHDEPGATYVWHKQSTSTVVSEKNMDTRHIIDCILKGINHKVEVQNIIMNFVKKFSGLVSVCCNLSQKNKKKRKRKKHGKEIMVQCFICLKFWKIHDDCFKNYYGKWSKHNHLFHCKDHMSQCFECNKLHSPSNQHTLNRYVRNKKVH